jgi:hypothetical protein
LAFIEKAKSDKYTMEVNTDTKVFWTEVHGEYLPEDSEAFVTKYLELSAQVDAKEWTLVVECAGLVTQDEDMLVLLGNCFRLYVSTGWKRVELAGYSTKVLQMQMKKLARDLGANFDFTDGFNKN